MPEIPEVNSFVDGKVVRIKPFGAIISLEGGQQGLVHISHVSNKFVQDINDYISVGDIVRVKVLSIDAESGKIALSIKEADSFKKKPAPSIFDEDVQKPVKESLTFEEKFKDWVRASNELQATLSKRKKRK